MLYLLDANVLIDANRDYYGIDSVPEFWEWLQHMGENGHVKIPFEIYKEITDGNDGLAQWGKSLEIKAALLLDEEVNIRFFRKVVTEGYAHDLTDDEIEKLGLDPFLVAYALVDIEQRRIVTTENSRPSRQRGNKHVPDVCALLGVTSVHAYNFFRTLGFKTNWRSQS